MSPDSPGPPAPPPLPAVKAEVFAVAHPIKLKVRERAGSPDAMLAAADRNIQALAGDYRTWLKDDIGRMREQLAGDWRDPARREVAARAIHGTAHDIKGQAATFGYPLITEIAGLLSRYLQVVPPGEQSQTEIVAHLDVLARIEAQDIRGDGGKVGRQIVAALEKMSAA